MRKRILYYKDIRVKRRRKGIYRRERHTIYVFFAKLLVKTLTRTPYLGNAPSAIIILPLRSINTSTG